MNNPVYVFAKWRVQEGQLDRVLELVKELATKTRAEPGNLLYKIYQSNSDVNILILYEGYEDVEAQQTHTGSQHFRELAIGKIVPLLEEREFVLSSLTDL